MKLFVKVKPKAKKEKVERIDGEHFVVAVAAPAEKGLANDAVIAALAEHFNVPKSRIAIVSGRTSREKVIEID
ncbi:DUF167 domain-containing protein [Patescibacteria group bacterium]|nr:DUF167 domain-containing protein [Patescibacteria group bacterium]MCL5114814.1 DUF167 domain-containing protein [Patescibacteria group bacterium]